MSFRVRKSSDRYNLSQNTSFNFDDISKKDMTEFKKTESYTYKYDTTDIDEYIPGLDKKDSIFKMTTAEQVFVFDKNQNEWKLVKQSEQYNYEPKDSAQDPVNTSIFPEIPDFESFNAN